MLEQALPCCNYKLLPARATNHSLKGLFNASPQLSNTPYLCLFDVKTSSLYTIKIKKTSVFTKKIKKILKISTKIFQITLTITKKMWYYTFVARKSNINRVPTKRMFWREKEQTNKRQMFAFSKLAIVRLRRADVAKWQTR